jgi:hypothetical protein
LASVITLSIESATSSGLLESSPMFSSSFSVSLQIFDACFAYSALVGALLESSSPPHATRPRLTNRMARDE